MKRISIIIRGRVQKVFFRQSTMEHAIKLGVVGFVKNEKDGSVYVEAEGTTSQLDAFVEWCKLEPVLANVMEIIVTEETSLKSFTEFTIKH